MPEQGEKSAPVPRYYFHLSGAKNVHDPFGLIRRDDMAAIQWATRLADALQKDSAISAVVVVAEDGREVARILTCEPSNR